MQVVTKIITSLAESSEDFEVTNRIESLYAGNPLITPSSFVVDHTDIKSWEVNTADGAAFNLDILALINVLTANLGGEVKTLHIQGRKKNKSANEIKSSCRFTITTNQGVMGSMGQITLADISNFGYTQFSVSNIVVPANELGILTIVVGINK